MSDYPDWLPELLTLNYVSQYSGEEENWNFYFNFIYQVYIREFKEDIFEFKSKRVTIRRHPEIDGRDYSFHHMLTEGEVIGGSEEDRVEALERAERICWPKAIIINHEDGGFVKVWTQLTIKRKVPRTLLWFNDEYLVVLQDTDKDYISFITAYPTEEKHRKRKLQKEYIECAKI